MAGTPPRPWLVRLSLATTAFAYGVICAGGNVKSKEAGLAVPDWPLSYGLPSPWVILALGALVGASALWIARAYRRQVTLVGPAVLLLLSAAILGFYLVQSPERWIQIENLRAEHGHRLLAGGLGILLLALIFAVLKVESRPAVRRLVVVAFAGYLAQAALGGLTVIIFLRASVYHAFLAQAEFGVLVALTLMLSRAWEEPIGGVEPRVRILAPLATAMIYVQIVLGALVRHTEGAALAMPGFPLPMLPATYTLPATLQLAHRCGAVLVAAIVAGTLVAVLGRHRDEPKLARPAAAMAALVAAQVLLGGAIVWTGRVDFVATAHVAVGSLIVACSLVASLQARRASAA